jgi:hypothetical protein
LIYAEDSAKQGISKLTFLSAALKFGTGRGASRSGKNVPASPFAPRPGCREAGRPSNGTSVAGWTAMTKAFKGRIASILATAIGIAALSAGCYVRERAPDRGVYVEPRHDHDHDHDRDHDHDHEDHH